MKDSSKLSEENIKIIKHLKEISLVKNISIINLIKNGLDFEYERKENAYFFRFMRKRDSDFRVYFCVKDIYELNEMKIFLKDSDTTFASIPKWIIPEISKDRKILWKENAYRFILPNNIEIKEEKEIHDTKLDIEMIKDKDISIINSLWPYRDENSEIYIGSRIKEGLSSGIYIEGEIAAWCLTHFDNSLAHLFVLDRFRRKNLAHKLLFHMSSTVRKSGRTPYLYSVKDNFGAHKLFEKLGYVKSEDVCWFAMK